MALDPALAAVRLAVRRSLIVRDDDGGSTVPGVGDGALLVACSGGADSLALLAATVFEVAKTPARVIGVTVDHGLQPGSADQAARVVEQMVGLGVDETARIRVTVDPGPAGIEAGAREARYAALSQLAGHFGAPVVLLGHTLDDQAETVLLGLARGSGGRSLQGMRTAFRIDEDPVETVPVDLFARGADGGSARTAGPGHSTLFSRPLLGLTRAQTEAACRAEAIPWWEDPQNADPAFSRVRVRQVVLPVMERELGPGVAAALARTAEQLRADMDFIDEQADGAFAEFCSGGVIDLVRLNRVAPLALCTRVVRRAAIEAGAIAAELSWEHVQAVRGIGPGKEVQLPGHVTAYRVGAQVAFRRTEV